MRFFSNLMKWGVARFSESVGLTLTRIDGSTVSAPYVLPFPDFQPSILASLVAGTTASQSGTTVTVTAATHGIVGSNARNGYRIYYPGSASIPAGWYPNFTWIDANNFSFTRATSASVASESVNGGSAYTSRVTVTTSSTIKGGATGLYGDVTIDVARAGTTATGGKVLYASIDGSDFSSLSLNSSNFGTFSHSLFALGSLSKQIGVAGPNGAASNTAPFYPTVDMSLDKTVSVSLQVQIAGQWASIEAIGGRITKR